MKRSRVGRQDHFLFIETYNLYLDVALRDGVELLFYQLPGYQNAAVIACVVKSAEPLKYFFLCVRLSIIGLLLVLVFVLFDALVVSCCG